MVRLCDICGSQDDVLPVAASYNPVRTLDLCPACRRSEQDRRDAAAARAALVADAQENGHGY